MRISCNTAVTLYICLSDTRRYCASTTERASIHHRMTAHQLQFFSRQISWVHHEQGRYKHAARKQNLWFTINIVLQIEKIQDKTFGVASGKFQTKKWWNEPSHNPLLSLLPTPPLSVIVSPPTVSALFLPPFSTHLLSCLHVSFPASQPLSKYSYELWREL